MPHLSISAEQMENGLVDFKVDVSAKRNFVLFCLARAAVQMGIPPEELMEACTVAFMNNLLEGLSPEGSA